MRLAYNIDIPISTAPLCEGAIPSITAIVARDLYNAYVRAYNMVVEGTDEISYERAGSRKTRRNRAREACP